MRVLRLLCVGVLAVLTATPPVLAGDPDAGAPAEVSFLRMGYVHFGKSAVKQADHGVLELGGATVPGAGYTTPLTLAPSIEAGVFLGEFASIAAFGTMPMPFDNVGTGTIAALGSLGTETIGLYSLTAKAHLPLRPSVVPYLGAGVGYMHVFGTTDGAITNLDIRPAAGFVAQGGVDFRLSDNFGAFVDFKTFLIGTTAYGSVGGVPVAARTRVDPWVATAGLSVWF